MRSPDLDFCIKILIFDLEGLRCIELKQKKNFNSKNCRNILNLKLQKQNIQDKIDTAEIMSNQPYFFV